jgi:enoyl-CoA hydratase/carnithine racemase
MVPRAKLESFTYSLAEEIAGNAPLSLKGTKRILNMLASSIKLNDGDQKEAEDLISQAFNSEDLKAAQTAFFEKRKPTFKGK